MNGEENKNLGASVRGRLHAHARQCGEDFQRTLVRYANERFLARLAASRLSKQFVLKGAMLFTVWGQQAHRATRDVDLLGFGPSEPESVLEALKEVLRTQVEGDGIHFEIDSLVVESIRDGKAYGGVRAHVDSHLTSARIRLQIDIGFGDAITPEATLARVPTLLGSPPPELLAYPPETVVAEKLEAMVQLGLANSRMKDFYDLSVLASCCDFDGQLLSKAIRATFERRRSQVPSSIPVALTEAFSEDPNKQAQWAGFIRKSGAIDAKTLMHTVQAVRGFVEQPLRAAAQRRAFLARWSAGGRWSEEDVASPERS